MWILFSPSLRPHFLLVSLCCTLIFHLAFGGFPSLRQRSFDGEAQSGAKPRRCDATEVRRRVVLCWCCCRCWMICCVDVLLPFSFSSLFFGLLVDCTSMYKLIFVNAKEPFLAEATEHVMKKLSMSCRFAPMLKKLFLYPQNPPRNRQWSCS